MYREINLQMEEEWQGFMRFQKINTRLKDLMKQKEELKEKVEELKAILDKEDIDVEKLEGKSLAHMFHSIFGNLDEHLDKERKEVLAAKLKYDQAVQDLENVNAQIDKLNSEKIDYSKCESTYRELYSRKKEMLLQSNTETTERILQLTEQLNQINNHRKEIMEAITAGAEAEIHLNNAANSLDSAEGWGTWDLLGGGFISDMAKHSHIDDAKIEVENVQVALSRFRTELADVRISSNINIETEGFAKFADFFFDGLIADWCMQSRINDSQESVNNVKDEVEQVLSKLKSMELEEATQVKQLENEMNELIIQV